MTPETWKTIPGWPSYEVSDLGRVRSLERKVTKRNGATITVKPRVLKPIRNKKGYVLIRTYDTHGRNKMITVHRLVAQAFLDNPLGRREVNHLDGCKENCAATNLEWTDSSGNKRHARDNGLLPRTLLSAPDVIAIRERYAKGEVGTALAREFRVSANTIISAVYGYSWADLPHPGGSVPQRRRQGNSDAKRRAVGMI